MKTGHSLDLPRRLQIEFSKVIQVQTDEEGGEVTPTEIWESFNRESLAEGGGTLLDHQSSSVADGKQKLGAAISVDGATHEIEGTGNGPISAFCAALASVGVDVRVLDFAEHALTEGTDAQAASYVEVATGDEVLWGVGIDTNTATASMRAILSAVNRSRRQ